MDVDKLKAYEEVKQDNHRQRVIRNFDRKYSQRGGITELLAMKTDGKSDAEVGLHFGLTRQRIHKIVKDIS